MIIKTLQIDNLRKLSDVLTQLDTVQEFRIAPTGD